MKYTFYDKNKNIEGVINFNSSCCGEATNTEYDNRENKKGWAKPIFECRCNICSWIEYDNYNCPIYTLFFYNECCNKRTKLYDQYNVEVNFTNKSLINNGFSKFQQVILISLFFPLPNNE